jgi:hypothetical protein
MNYKDSQGNNLADNEFFRYVDGKIYKRTGNGTASKQYELTMFYDSNMRIVWKEPLKMTPIKPRTTDLPSKVPFLRRLLNRP